MSGSVFTYSGENGGSYPIELKQTGRDRFIVRYGLQVRGGLGYADAAKALGECIMHALACEGKLDND